MTSLSTRACEEHIYTTLLADAQMVTLVGNRVWGYLMTTPALAVRTPYVIYANLSALDVAGVGPAILMTSLLFLVRGVVEDVSFQKIEPVADRIQTLLHGSMGTNQYGVIHGCVRDKPYVQPELTNGRSFRHLGGIYRFYTG